MLPEIEVDSLNRATQTVSVWQLGQHKPFEEEARSYLHPSKRIMNEVQSISGYPGMRASQVAAGACMRRRPIVLGRTHTTPRL
jgi:hypothetical protein